MGNFDEEFEQGMTDEQFKVFLVSILEYVKKAESVEEVKKYLKTLLKEMK